MERGDLMAVIIGLSLVILLTVILSPAAQAPRQATKVVPTSPVPTTPEIPARGTTAEPAPSVPPTLPPVTARRIVYTENYSLYPVRFLPSDMTTFGSPGSRWPYHGSVVFAYLEEGHGGLTENFTVSYPVWRMTCTLEATRKPEHAVLKILLVDEKSGVILGGGEIRSSGSITKNMASSGRPLYIITETEHVDRFLVNLEAPAPGDR